MNWLLKIAGALALFLAVLGAWRYSSSQGVQVRELYAEDLPSFDHPASLTRDQTKRDIAILKLALDRAYAGSYAFPEEFKKLQAGLDGMIDEPGLGEWKTFVERINTVFSEFPDAHLTAESIEVQQRWASESEFALPEGETPPYEFEVQKTETQRTFVARFKSFAIYDKAAMDEVVQKFKENLTGADNLLIDLRGNRGGSLDFALKLASVVWGEEYRGDRSPIQDFPTPIAKQAVLYSTGALAVLANWKSLQKSTMKRTLASLGRVGPYSTLKDRFDRISRGAYSLDSYLKSDLTDVLNDEENHQLYASVDPAKKGFGKRIAIVTDNGCASSCERFLESLEAHPTVTTFGQNTAGAVRFSALGLLVLPESRIAVPIATQYEIYKDDRKVERTGYVAKVATGQGEEGFVRAWEFLRAAQNVVAAAPGVQGN